MQEKIIKLLEKKKEPLSRTEIANILKRTPISVSKTLRVLLKHDEIKCIEIDRIVAYEKYKPKKRMRLYYYDLSTTN